MSIMYTIKLRSGKTVTTPYYTGQGIGQFADAAECKSVAEAVGVRSIYDYCYRDPEICESIAEEIEDEGIANEWTDQIRSQVEWHDAEQGLKTVRALLAHFRLKAENKPDDEYLTEVINDLTVYEQYLEVAAQDGDMFHLEVSE